MHLAGSIDRWGRAANGTVGRVVCRDDYRETRNPRRERDEESYTTRGQLSPSQITVRATWQRVEHLGKQRWHVCRDATTSGTEFAVVVSRLASHRPISLSLRSRSRSPSRTREEKFIGIALVDRRALRTVYRLSRSCLGIRQRACAILFLRVPSSPPLLLCFQHTYYSRLSAACTNVRVAQRGENTRRERKREGERERESEKG